MESNRGIKEILLLGVVVLFLVGGFMLLIGGAVWASFLALEDRFGANVAVLVFGGVFVLAAFIGGALFSARIARKSQESFLRGLGELGDVMRGTAGVQREQLRGEREAFKLAAGAQLVNERRVNQLADQKARLLADAQRQAAAGPTWDRGTIDGETVYRSEAVQAQPAQGRAQYRYVE